MYVTERGSGWFGVGHSPCFFIFNNLIHAVYYTDDTDTDQRLRKADITFQQ